MLILFPDNKYKGLIRLTRKLYWENPYDIEFTATVKSVKERGIILDQTLFYPFGGNQLSDQGILTIKTNNLTVSKVTKKNNEILHHISSNFHQKLKVGDTVIGKIDWNRRYGLMKSHTSQHIFSAVIKNKYDIDTVRATLNFEEINISFSQSLSYHQLETAVQEINEICCTKNLSIKENIVPQEEIGNYKNEIRGGIPDEKQIRTVGIQDLDLVCCGGTHIKNSTEIGLLFIYDFKKGKDVKYYIGTNAIIMITTINMELVNVSNLLNISIKNIREKTERNIELISNLRERNETLILKNLELIAQNPIIKIKDILIYFIELETEYRLLSKNLHLFPEESVIVVKISPKKYRFVSKNQLINANSILHSFLKIYGGKGGGNPTSAQSNFDRAPEDLISDLKQFIKSFY